MKIQENDNFVLGMLLLLWDQLVKTLRRWLNLGPEQKREARPSGTSTV